MWEIDPWEKLAKSEKARNIYSKTRVIETLSFSLRNDQSVPEDVKFSRNVKDCYYVPVLKTRKNSDPKHPRINNIPIQNPFYLKDPVMSLLYPADHLKQSTSQHMAAVIDSMDKSFCEYPSSEVIITSQTLQTISETVFKQEKKWKLRAYLENRGDEKFMIICDDDLHKYSLDLNNNLDNDSDNKNFQPSKNLQSIDQASQLVEIITAENNYLNESCSRELYGCLCVNSVINIDDKSMDMIVVGQYDTYEDGVAINTYVATGTRRKCELVFGDNDLTDECFQYLWGRSFWIGIDSHLFGVRREDDKPIEMMQRYRLKDLYSKHSRCTNNKAADYATICVARVLFKLRDIFATTNHQNLAIEYDGCGEDEEPPNIIIKSVDQDVSFWLIRERHHLLENKTVDDQPSTSGRGLKERPKNVCDYASRCKGDITDLIQQVKNDYPCFAEDVSGDYLTIGSEVDI